MSIKTKVSISLSILIGISIGLSGVVTYHYSSEALLSETVRRATTRMEFVADDIESGLAYLRRNVLTLASLTSVAAVVSDHSRSAARRQALSSLAHDFISMARNQEDYFQIRYLDAAGMERVRVDRTAQGLRVVDERDLQDKSSESYFKDAVATPHGEVYVSPMELNREHGVIEVPHRPTIRVASPVQDSGRERTVGVVIINVDGKKLLNRVVPDTGTAYLVNEAGYYLKHPDARLSFGFDTGSSNALAMDFPVLWSKVNSPAKQFTGYFPDGAARVDNHVLGFKKIWVEPRNQERYWAIVMAIPDSIALVPARQLRLVFVALGLIVAASGALAGYFWAMRLAKPIIALAGASQRVQDGDLTVQAKISGSTELVVLGAAFNGMTAKLRESQAAIAESVSSLSSTSAELLAGTTNQAAGAQQHAAAVAETATTVDEVLQTTTQAAERAKFVSEAAQRSQEGGRSGLDAVEETLQGMVAVREQVEEMTQTILRLAEQAQAIGEIITTVNDLAEQTNLLAVNAAIEASRAGEHGRGFAVVATEVRALAEESKRATAEVRRILGAIQETSNSAVMVTEQGTRSVASAMELANRAGESIRLLQGTIAESAQAAMQISASAGQQQIGVSQIQQAMKEINQVSVQNLAATRQTEQAARDLSALGSRLGELVARQEANA